MLKIQRKTKTIIFFITLICFINPLYTMEMKGPCKYNEAVERALLILRPFEPINEPTLHQLIRKNAFFGEIEELIKKDNSVHIVNEKNIQGTPPLHLAVKMENGPIMNLLCKYGADLNGTAFGGCTPLMEAIYKRDISMVKLLWNLGADLDYEAPKSFNRTALYNAVEITRIEDWRSKLFPIIAFLLEHGKADVERKNFYSQKSPLDLARDYNYPELVELLERSKLSRKQIVPYNNQKQIVLYRSPKEILINKN